MSRSNKISADFSVAHKADVLSKINDIKEMMPFLISLTIEERKKLRKMGPKSVAYVQKCLEGAQAFPNELKVNFDAHEMAKDVSLVDNLLGVQIACQALLELVVDTMTAAGIDAMGASDEVYASLKSSAKSNANVKAMVEQIAERFKAQGRRKPATIPVA